MRAKPVIYLKDFELTDIGDNYETPYGAHVILFNQPGSCRDNWPRVFLRGPQDWHVFISNGGNDYFIKSFVDMTSLAVKVNKGKLSKIEKHFTKKKLNQLVIDSKMKTGDDDT